MAWPAWPWVACRSWAMGVSRLTGMNSEAISRATQRAREPTALPRAVLPGADGMGRMGFSRKGWALALPGQHRER